MQHWPECCPNHQGGKPRSLQWACNVASSDSWCITFLENLLGQKRAVLKKIKQKIPLMELVAGAGGGLPPLTQDWRREWAGGWCWLGQRSEHSEPTPNFGVAVLHPDCSGRGAGWVVLVSGATLAGVSHRLGCVWRDPRRAVASLAMKCSRRFDKHGARDWECEFA